MKDLSRPPKSGKRKAPGVAAAGRTLHLSPGNGKPKAGVKGKPKGAPVAAGAAKKAVNGVAHVVPLDNQGAAVVTNLFKAVAEPNRVRILFLIEKGELSVGQIATAMGTTRPALSRHLRVLRTCGLVSDRRDGNRLFYVATEDGGHLVEVARRFQ